jgi:hypothetical protein
MIRALVVAAAIACAALGMAPTAGADSRHFDTDVPGMNYDASLSAPCERWDRFIFGRGPGGEVLECHWIPNQWPPVNTGFWVISYPLYGVQDIGTPCPNPRGASAQSPDGIALWCTESGWQPRPL